MFRALDRRVLWYHIILLPRSLYKDKYSFLICSSYLMRPSDLTLESVFQFSLIPITFWDTSNNFWRSLISLSFYTMNVRWSTYAKHLTVFILNVIPSNILWTASNIGTKAKLKKIGAGSRAPLKYAPAKLNFSTNMTIY